MATPMKYKARATANAIHAVRRVPRAVRRAVAAATTTLARAAGASERSPT